jgi:O-antigen ligase
MTYPALHQSKESKFGLISFIALVSGLTSLIEFKILGQLFLGEVILAVLGFILLLNQFTPSARPIHKNILNDSLFIKFLMALCVSFIGFIISDFWVNSPPSDYLRGWAKIIFLILDMVALSFCGWQSRWNLWWFSLGIGLSIITSKQLTTSFVADWKVVYAEPASFLVLCLAPFLKSPFSLIGIGGLGVINILLDYRSFGLIFILVATLAWAKEQSNSQPRKQMLKLLLSIALAGSLLLSLYQFTQDEFSDRREESNIARFGGIQVAIEAIAESPIIGHGSWAKSDALAERFLNLTDGDRSFGSVDRIYAQQIIPTHSQILQVWVEGGILGTTFFIFYGYKLVTSIVYYVKSNYDNVFFALFLFSLVNSLWHLCLSPFASTQRMSIALAVSVICLINKDKERKERLNFLT